MNASYHHFNQSSRISITYLKPYNKLVCPKKWQSANTNTFNFRKYITASLYSKNSKAEKAKQKNCQPSISHDFLEGSNFFRSNVRTHRDPQIGYCWPDYSPGDCYQFNHPINKITICLPRISPTASFFMTAFKTLTILLWVWYLEHRQ